MKVSLNSIKGMNKRYNCAADITPNGVTDLLEKIGSQLGGIDEAIDLSTKYDKVVIVKVIECTPHPDSDHMNVCRIDDGGMTPNVARGENGLIQVVCGAPNVTAGLTVVWLPPGATVPESYGKDPFVLGARELRGVTSHGMLASPRELALGDSHEGILVITDEIAPGTQFADQYDLRGDVIVDIENKMFTHRPDAFGTLGIARELAGIQGLPFKSPDWYRLHPEVPGIEAEALTLTVRNELPELVPRFSAIVLRDVELTTSPLWLQIELAKYGLRSISNIVDYTNFFMIETGQPLHAYDYDKLVACSGENGAEIVIRHPREDEQLTLLNGKTITPRSEAIMIATDTQLIGLAGIMGGADTEVDDSTKNIVLEVATFDMYSIRRSSMAHGLFTDAVTRFNKGQSPLQNIAVLAKIVDEIRRYAKGKIASNLIDETELQEREWVHPPVPVTTSFINNRLGLDLTAKEMKGLLENVECRVDIDSDNLTITAPFWRTDIETREDVVEEIGRLYGFDKLPLELPQRTIKPTAKDAQLVLKQLVRGTLAQAGANEILSYSFVHGDLLEKVGQHKESAFQVSNALSPELQYYRLSVTPSLLDKVHMNIKAGYDQLALFEIGKTHIQGQEVDGLPTEFENVALVYTANDKVAKSLAGAPFYQAKLMAETLLHQLGIPHSIDPVDFDLTFIADQINAAPFDANRLACIRIGDRVAGFIGEYSPKTRRNLKLPAYSAGFELSLFALAPKQDGTYIALSKFPSVTQDITLRLPADVSYATLHEFMRGQINNEAPNGTTFALDVRDIYQRADDIEHKQVTFRLELTSYDKTMTDKQVSTLLGLVANAAKEKFGAEQV